MNTEHLDWQPVVSSQLKAVAYEPHKEGATMGTVFVQFSSGATWQYEDVPEERYRHLLEASSKGNFFGKNIKGRYPEKQIFCDEAEGAGDADTGKQEAGGTEPSSGSAASSPPAETGNADAGVVGSAQTSSPAGVAAPGASTDDGHTCSAEVKDGAGNPHPMTAQAQDKAKKAKATPAVKKSAGGKKAAA